MGSSSTIIRVEEEYVLPAISVNSQFASSRKDANLLEDRVVDTALMLWDGRDYYGTAPKMTPLTPEELSQDAMYAMDGTRFTAIVPLMKKSDYDIKVKNVKVHLDGAEWAAYMGSYYPNNNVLMQKILVAHPELAGVISNISVKIPEAESKMWRNRVSAGWKVSSTIEADTSGGKTKQVFELIVDGKKVSGEYETQAKARAAGTALMRDNFDISAVKVTSKTVREDGSELVSLKRSVSSAVANVVVSYVKVNKKNPERDGFLVLIRYRD